MPVYNDCVVMIDIPIFLNFNNFNNFNFIKSNVSFLIIKNSVYRVIFDTHFSSFFLFSLKFNVTTIFHHKRHDLLTVYNVHAL